MQESLTGKCHPRQDKDILKQFGGILINAREKIEKFILENQIELEDCEELSNFGKSALYFEAYGAKRILLGSDFHAQNKHAKIDILAEELGHFATSVGDCTERTGSYIEKIKIDKAEYKAMKWANSFLVDENELRKAMKTAVTFEELSDIMDLSTTTIINFFILYAKRSRYFYIDKNKRIDLFKLPNLHIEDC